RWIIGPESLLLDGEGAAVESFRLRVVVPDIRYPGEIVERVRDVRMGGTKSLLPYRQGSEIDGFGVRVVRRVVVQHGATMQRIPDEHIVRPKRLFAEGERGLRRLQRFFVCALGPQISRLLRQPACLLENAFLFGRKSELAHHDAVNPGRGVLADDPDVDAVR